MQKALISIVVLPIILVSCSPAWWPFEAKVAEDVIEDVDQELKSEVPQDPLPQPQPQQIPEDKKPDLPIPLEHPNVV